MRYNMDYQRNTKVIEIGVIILFIVSTTFLIFNGEIFLSYFKEKDVISKEDFKKVLSKSFFQSIVIDSGLIVFYFINKARIKKGKKPI